MNNLEKLVPPLELCKQIPEGAFCDSALVHAVVFCKSCSLSANNVVVPCSVVEDSDQYRYICPAPTLAEILEALAKMRPLVAIAKRTSGEWESSIWRADPVFDADNPATAALKLWLEINSNGK